MGYYLPPTGLAHVRPLHVKQRKRPTGLFALLTRSRCAITSGMSFRRNKTCHASCRFALFVRFRYAIVSEISLRENRVCHASCRSFLIIKRLCGLDLPPLLLGRMWCLTSPRLRLRFFTSPSFQVIPQPTKYQGKPELPHSLFLL